MATSHLRELTKPTAFVLGVAKQRYKLICVIAFKVSISVHTSFELCSSRRYPRSPPPPMEIPREVEGSQRVKNVKKCMRLN